MATKCISLVKTTFFYLIFIYFLRQSPTLSARLECSGLILTHCYLYLLSSSSFPASASQVAEIPSACQQARVIFIFLVEMGFCHIGQAGLELLTSSDLSALASQSAGITGVNHHAWPFFFETESRSVTQAGMQ